MIKSAENNRNLNNNYCTTEKQSWKLSEVMLTMTKSVESKLLS